MEHSNIKKLLKIVLLAALAPALWIAYFMMLDSPVNPTKTQPKTDSSLQMPILAPTVIPVSK
jgi:hypothetical protein